MSARHLERRAIIGTLHKFSDILSGQRMVIRVITDHKGLQALKNNSRDAVLTREESTELEFFNRHRLDITYAPGESPLLRTSDLLSRNLPSHADEIGSFRGGEEGSPWSVNLKNASIRDDVQLESTTPDDTSQLRLNKPALEWDGPAIEDAATDVVMLEAPEIHY